jgi:hypothetical protein
MSGRVDAGLEAWRSALAQAWVCPRCGERMECVVQDMDHPEVPATVVCGRWPCAELAVGAVKGSA